ncbi:MAG: hypothetical protein KGJ77_08360, partial [Acidobacteriota bacterium]|nr:hypothetical protein [Acidobacteriota bacterium]
MTGTPARGARPAWRSGRGGDERGQAAMLVVMAVVVVMITVPVAFELQASRQPAVTTTALYAQDALAAAEAGVQDYADHLQAGGAGYLSYCSKDYFTSCPAGSGEDASNQAFLDDNFGSGANDDRTNPSGATKWVRMPSNKGGSSSGTSYGATEAYDYLVDTSAYKSTTAGSYPVNVYATGRAGAGTTFLYRRVKATIEVTVTSQTAQVSQPVTWQNSGGTGASCTGSPPTSGGAITTPVPSWASYAAVVLAGGAGGSGGSSLDPNVPAGGTGAGFTASIPVTPGSTLSLYTGCAGSGLYGGVGSSSGGDGSGCNPITCFLLGGSLGGPGGGGGGASAVICTASCANGTNFEPLAVAGGGGGGGGD